MQKQKQPSDSIRKLSNILTDVSNAYKAASTSFHNYFKRSFDLSLRTNLMIKEKYIKSLYRDVDLYEFVDETVRYRIGISSKEPNKSKFMYSMNDPYMLTESLDDVLYRIMYSAYPPEVLNDFKNYLESYIKDDRIVDLILSKLEIDVHD